jgi:hypothetical protein
VGAGVGAGRPPGTGDGEGEEELVSGGEGVQVGAGPAVGVLLDDEVEVTRGVGGGDGRVGARDGAPAAFRP